MKRWRYWVECFADNPDPQGWLSQRGNEGWELVSMVLVDDLALNGQPQGKGWVAIWKQEKG